MSDAAATSGTTGGLRRLLVLGLAWLIVGMAVMPSGVSYNPGKAYQQLLALSLWLPVLALAALHPRRLLELCRQPLMAAVIALAGWAWLSLAWSEAPSRGDEAGRVLSVLLFLVGAQWVFGGGVRHARGLLVGTGLAMAAAALAFIVDFVLDPPIDGRLAGVGVMGNANLAAAGMGAALIGLWPWRLAHPGWRVARAAAIGVLALFVLLSFSRSAWAALFLALLAMTLCRGGVRAGLVAGLLCVLGVLGAALAFEDLVARGWSLRPQILAEAWTLFQQQPLHGLGQGTPFRLEAGGQAFVHAHNLFAQLALELGAPALLLWAGIWAALGWRAWRHRHEELGRLVLGLWVFGTVAVQFDLPHLLDSPRPGWLLTWLPLALGLGLGRPDESPR